MYKIIFFQVILVIFSFPVSAQQLSTIVNYVTVEAVPKSNNIIYQPGQMLNWDDFKGTPVEGSPAAALTNAGLAIKLAFQRAGNTSQLVLSVNCNFSKKDSWVKKGNKNAYILDHEQKHFDIAYIHTLLFIQALKDASLNNSNYVAEIEKIYRESVAAMSKMQNEYDMQTSHSRNAEQQAMWDEKINKLLASFVKQSQ